MAFAGAIISGVFSLVGAMAQASAMEEQADAEEKIAQYNAKVKRQEAAYAQSKGAQESEQVAKEGRRRAALARAATAQGGLSTSSGTPLTLEAEFAAETEYNENVVMANAQRESDNMENSAKIEEYEGTVRANSTRSKAAATRIGGIGSFLGGVGKAAASLG